MKFPIFAPLILLALATPVVAQEVRVAPGLVWHGAIFGDDDPKSTGSIRPTIGVITRGQVDRRAGFTFEARLEPIGIRNPHFDERLHSLDLLAGVEIGRRFTIRPGAGVVVQSWMGRDAESAFGIAPALSIAIGHRHAGGGFHISPEFVGRASFTHGALSWMAGLQIPITVPR